MVPLAHMWRMHTTTGPRENLALTNLDPVGQLWRHLKQVTDDTEVRDLEDRKSVV